MPAARGENSAAYVTQAREKLGRMWGLERSLTRAELARALDLSQKFGGSHISKLEIEDPKRRATLSGPVEVAIQLMLDGGVPYTMAGVVKPGYPRGSAQ